MNRILYLGTNRLYLNKNMEIVTALMKKVAETRFFGPGFTEPDILKILQSQFIVEKDYRVKVNILKAFGSYKYIDNIDLSSMNIMIDKTENMEIDD